MIAKRKKLEEEQAARAADMRRPKNSLVYDTSHGCPVCERVIRAVRRSSRNEAEKNSHSTEFSSYNTEDGTSKFEIRIANSQVGNEKVFERYCNLSKLSVEE